MTKMKASLTWLSAAMPRWAMEEAADSSSVRSSQSVSLTKAMPAFWPMPAKLKPCTLSTDSTYSDSFSRKWFSSARIDSMVRSWVAPTGVCTIAISTPWSSSGRNELGVRMKASTITPVSAAKISMKRPGRARMPRTPRR